MFSNQFRLIAVLIAWPLMMFGQGSNSLDFDFGRGPDHFDPADWPMYNHDAQGTRFNRYEQQLNRDSVRSLRVKWVFPTSGDVYATPAVVGHLVYAGDVGGNFYALTDEGSLLWTTKVNAPITASALVTHDLVVFGDQAGYIYGLDRQIGKILWSVRPNPHPYAAIYGSPILVKGDIVIGISSNEEALEGTPSCCSFRGSVVSLSPADGKIAWQTYMITEEERSKGASGASVWSTPTYDEELDTIYVTTGNNYTAPATRTSDAFVALDACTGKIVWTHQTVHDDIDNIDADFGDSPQIYRIRDGRKVIGAGEKVTGTYYVVDPKDGSLINEFQAVPSCPHSEGLFADSAVAYGLAFVNGVNCEIPANPPLVPPSGVVAALEGNGSGEKWAFKSDKGPVLSGIAVANGVVYFMASGLSSTLYALNAETGEILATATISGGISGPSISHGQLYVGTGALFASGVPTPTGIVALGL